MAEFTVRIPEQDVAMFISWLNERGYAHSPLDTDEVPEWQKEEVRRIRASNKPEDYVSWEEVQKTHFRSE